MTETIPSMNPRTYQQRGSLSVTPLTMGEFLRIIVISFLMISMSCISMRPQPSCA